MKIKFFIALGILLAFGLIAVFDLQTTPTAIDAINKNTIKKQISAPNISFKTTDGRAFSLSDFSDKVILLNFWASWCQPCLTEFPIMMNLIENFGDKVVLIAISKDQHRKDIDRFLNKFPKYKNNENLYIVHDKDKSLSEGQFNTFKIPETIFIDKQGMMVRKIIGASPIWEKPVIKNELQTLIDGASK